MRGVFNDTSAIFFLLSYKSVRCWYLFEMPRLVEALQTSTNNICVYKKVDPWPVI